MQATELLVELVLTGLLMLTVLLCPAVAAGELVLKLTPETITVVIAVAFALGVVVDRCADSVLAGWEAHERLVYAMKSTTADQRLALCGTRESVRDVFPDDWLRMYALRHGGEIVYRELERRRVRIRVARTATMLVPPLVVSALLAIWARVPEAPAERLVLVPGVHLVLLALLFWISEHRHARPDTRCPEQVEDWVKGRTNERRDGLATIWLVVQATFAVGVAVLLPDEARSSGWLLLVIGTCVATVAAMAWIRLTATFFEFLWNHARFNDPAGTAAACKLQPMVARTAEPSRTVVDADLGAS